MTRFGAIVIGSGSAGLFAALELHRDMDVAVVTKAAVADASTYWAQGGVAAAVSRLDSPEQHLADTIAAGAGLVDEEAARVLCEEGPEIIAELARYGVRFDETQGIVDLAQEAAHSVPRVLHAGGDQTGAEIERALADQSRRSSVATLAGAQVTRLLVDGDIAQGVEILRNGKLETLEADAVVIATGGAGQLFASTTNPAVATADGTALAFKAGAEVTDLEFFQFHPTALKAEGQRPFLISEAIRGEGAVLRNRSGEAFMNKYSERAELAPRDIVSRSIASEMRETGSDSVYLDCTNIGHLDVRVRFPSIYAFCREAGIDISADLVPVAPAAHYFMGGVRTDIWGRTTIRELYACGEASATGIHGANRLASNSLLETVVFARRVACSVRERGKSAAPPSVDVIELEAPLRHVRRSDLQALLWENAGIERHADGLAAAAAAIDSAAAAPEPATFEEHEDQNLILTGRLMVDAALRRTESRGAHHRSDFPNRDDQNWKRRQSLKLAGSGMQ